MLDRYIIGRYTRKSPEADVPIILVPRGGPTSRLGGAANVARACRILGAKHVDLWGNVGGDTAGASIMLKLTKSGVNPSGLMTNLKRTIVKTRVLAGTQQVCRVDEEDIGVDVQYSRGQLGRLFNLASEADRIVVSDYNKGCITEAVMAVLEPFAERVYIDPKPVHRALYGHCAVIKPNAEEVYMMAPAPTHAESAMALRDALGVSVVATSGYAGAVLAELGAAAPRFYSGHEVETVDAIGAGDIFMAALAVCEKPLVDAVDYANRTAALSTTQPFTYCPGESNEA